VRLHPLTSTRPSCDALESSRTESAASSDKPLLSCKPLQSLSQVAVKVQPLTFFVTDPFAEADEDTGETKQSQNYIHIRIQRE
jgi:hypothetical protein